MELYDQTESLHLGAIIPGRGLSRVRSAAWPRGCRAERIGGRWLSEEAQGNPPACPIWRQLPLCGTYELAYHGPRFALSERRHVPNLAVEADAGGCFNCGI